MNVRMSERIKGLNDNILSWTQNNVKRFVAFVVVIIMKAFLHSETINKKGLKTREGFNFEKRRRLTYFETKNEWICEKVR